MERRSESRMSSLVSAEINMNRRVSLLGRNHEHDALHNAHTNCSFVCCSWYRRTASITMFGLITLVYWRTKELKLRRWEMCTSELSLIFLLNRLFYITFFGYLLSSAWSHSIDSMVQFLLDRISDIGAAMFICGSTMLFLKNSSRKIHLEHGLFARFIFHRYSFLSIVRLCHVISHLQYRQLQYLAIVELFISLRWT